MNVLVDTDVRFIHLQNHPIGKRYDSDLTGRVAPISFMTVAVGRPILAAAAF